MGDLNKKNNDEEEEKVVEAETVNVDRFLE